MLTNAVNVVARGVVTMSLVGIVALLGLVFFTGDKGIPFDPAVAMIVMIIALGVASWVAMSTNKDPT